NHLSRAGTSDEPGWRILVQHIAGFSPLAAREAMVRATGDPEAEAAAVSSWQAVAEAVRALVEPLETGAWQPTVARRGDRVLDYAPFSITQFAGAEVDAYSSMSAAVLAATERAASAPAFDRLKAPLLDALAARVEQGRRKRSSLERSLAAADTA